MSSQNRGPIAMGKRVHAVVLQLDIEAACIPLHTAVSVQN
jgi:hypothetical protein